MSYIRESLAPNEALICVARFHWLQRGAGHATLAAFLLLAIVPARLLEGTPAIIGAVVLAVAGLVVFVRMMLPIWTSEIGVTNHRFIYKRGWLRRVTDELQLTSIEEVNLDQGAIGRMLDFGRLVLHGTGMNDIRLPTLADPVGLRRALQEGMGAARAAVVVPPVASSTVTTPERHAAE